MNAVFISGAIGGNPHFKRDFDRAAKELRKAGFRPVNPIKIVPKDWPWGMAMKLCTDLIDLSDAVLLLDGWFRSEGARREMYYATATGKPLAYGIKEIPYIRTHIDKQTK